jgi:hypothetical protein
VDVSPNAQQFRERRSFYRADGLVAETAHNGDVSKLVNRQWHTDGNIGRSVQHFPTPQIDNLIEAQHRELDIERRWGILKELQLALAAHMPATPGRHLFTTFAFRWPWLHNLAYGTLGSTPPGQPALGGHLHWLSEDMPGRDTGAV